MKDEDPILKFLESESKEEIDFSAPIKGLDTLASMVESAPAIKKESSKQDFYVPPKQVKVQKSIHPVSKGFDVSKFKQNLIKRLIDDYKSYENYERPYLSVGEILSCMRAVYFARKKYAIDYYKKFSFPFLLFFQERGIALHRIVQNAYGMEKIDYTIISKVYKVKGKCDGVLGNFLYEIKIVDPDKFTGTYNPKDFNQANIYAYILNSEYKTKFDTITLVYVIGDLKHVIPIDVPVDMPKGQKMMQKASVLWSCIRENKIPEDNFCVMDECNFCAYKKYCEPKKKVEKEKKNEPAFLL